MQRKRKISSTHGGKIVDNRHFCESDQMLVITEKVFKIATLNVQTTRESHN